MVKLTFTDSFQPFRTTILAMVREIITSCDALKIVRMDFGFKETNFNRSACMHACRYSAQNTGAEYGFGCFTIKIHCER